jgi:hypothetical protein
MLQAWENTNMAERLDTNTGENSSPNIGAIISHDGKLSRDTNAPQPLFFYHPYMVIMLPLEVVGVIN